MTRILRIAKSILLFSVFLFTRPDSFGQSGQAKYLPNFLLPEFAEGIIKYRNGETKSAVMNYNIIDQELVLAQDDRYMAVEYPQLIDTVYVKDRLLVPFQKNLWELALSAPVALFIRHRGKLELAGAEIGYGQTSRSSGGQYLRQIYGPTSTYSLEIPEGHKVVNDSEYWIRRPDGSLENFTTRRQFLKIFAREEKALNQFINKNRIDFTKASDVVKLVAFCNELNQ
ncbi:MAG: hypothetical protein K0B05_06305 [Bacteroidales bacterium]|nr:hypothetical protein [Bacteroidales bacterium]